METIACLFGAMGAILGGGLAITLERKYPDTVWARRGVGTAIVLACSLTPPLIVSAF